jgi:hypothetical protein
MFNKNSRYYNLEIATGKDIKGRSVRAVKLRYLPATTGSETMITASDQLDVMAKNLYRDATRFWHIADANSEMEANELVETTGRVIKVPDR